MKRAFLYSLIGSVGVSAVLGVVAILSGDFGETEAKILLTTVVVSVASVCALCCAALIEKGRFVFLAGTGIAASAVAGLLAIVAVWAEISSDGYLKTTAVISLFAAATAHVALLSIARLQGGGRWVLAAAFLLVYALAGLIAVMIVWELEDEALVRILGVDAILVAGLSIVIPILHRLSGASEPAVSPGLASPRRTRMECPGCGRTLRAPPGETECPDCGCVFDLRIVRAGHAPGNAAPGDS